MTEIFHGKAERWAMFNILLNALRKGNGQREIPPLDNPHLINRQITPRIKEIYDKWGGKNEN